MKKTVLLLAAVSVMTMAGGNIVPVGANGSKNRF